MSEKLTTKEDVICIALNEEHTKDRDLINSELKNGTSVWKSSGRFVGEYWAVITLTNSIYGSRKLTILDPITKLPFDPFKTKENQLSALKISEDTEVHFDIYYDKETPILEASVSPVKNPNK